MDDLTWEETSPADDLTWETTSEAPSKALDYALKAPVEATGSLLNALSSGAEGADMGRRQIERENLKNEMAKARLERSWTDALQGLATGAGAATELVSGLEPGNLMERTANIPAQLAGSNLRVGRVVSPDQVSNFLFPTPEQAGTVSQGIRQGVSELGSGMTDFQNLAGLAAGLKYPELVGRQFQVQMASQVPAATQQLVEAVKSGEPAEIGKAAVQLAATGATPALIEKGIRDASTVREDTGQLHQAGNEPTTSQEVRGNDVEQAPPEQHQPVVEGERSPAQQEVKAPPSSALPGESPAMAPAESSANQAGATTPPAGPAKAQGASVVDPTQIGSETQPVTDKGIAASVRTKWASATDPNSEAGFVNLDPLRDLVDKATPYVKSAIQFAKDVGKEQLNLSKLGDYGKSVLDWSMKQQRSFQEAYDAQREIQQKVPDKVRREGITNWIQSNGDASVLANRAAATSDPKLKKGYEAALNLTPEEIAVANDVRNAYQALGQRGTAYDVLRNFKDNYVTQVWNLKKGPVFAGARTLRDKFRFSKASTFDTFFDGEQAGYTPKTKDIAKLLPTYLHEMNSVIAARQLVQDLNRGVASDGRPLVVPRGNAASVSNTGGSATLVMPKNVPADTADYKTLPNQPALNDWRWVSRDSAGNPVFLKSDLALHPEAYDKLKNVLGRSAIREWYTSSGSAAAAIPKAIVRGLDYANSGTKRTMLGLIAPFHQVQEGTHAIGHRVNPFWSIPKIDLVNDAGQMDAARHGLMLQPDRASANQFMEGFKQSGLVSHIPGIGPMADMYSNYLFHQYIPGLKYKTYEAIVERNRKVYADELSAGRVSEADVKHLSAEQANAAYGHLNYTDLARNPTVQHLMQLGALAPDFLEARARFTGQAIKGITGGKVGREQLLALATLAIAQAATAYTAAKLSGGDWDQKHPFEFHVGNRRYAMRSVPEDIASLINDWRKFVYSRISPIIGKGALQYLSRTDWRGQPISAGETTKELLQQPIPISLRGFLGLGRQSLSGMEQLASASGLRISRYSPSSDVFDMAKKWMESSTDPRVKARLERQQHEAHPVSEYKPLRNALADDNTAEAKKAYTELLKTKTPQQINRAMAHRTPFTGSGRDEAEFVKSLSKEQKKIYDEAIAERARIYQRFQKLSGGG